MKIAIVGMAFRFPGDISTENAFWDVLSSGRDMVSTVPPERWGTEVYQHPKRSEPGRSVTFSAGVLSKIDEFDAAFFGTSPREAKDMDPQQRMLLEMTWEALENGGQVPAKLAGTDCAVYIGISSGDYGMRTVDDLSTISAYSMTGNTLSIAANRISYVFDLHGPSMIIDTACSSSMVALHQACQSLRNGEASTAITGGVHLLLHPYPFVGFTKASMLSAGGRCRTFDAEGDGYVRAEGGAILFLKPYEQALQDGDPIHATILASGVNTDGYKSGITIPSAPAQAALIQSVCRQAGIEPDDIAYIEAHGTGTAVGDPIETAAIGEAIGKARSPSNPLYVGSVKSNIGHMEPASGMGGLVKTVLCMKHRALPPSLHLETPNPHIDFAGLRLKPVTELTPLTETQGPLRMGVNSFGFGGANAHVLLEEPPRAPATAEAQDDFPLPPLFLSTKDPKALRQLAAAYADHLARAGMERYYDIAHSAAFRRQRLDRQAVIFGPTPQAIEERLRQFAEGKFTEGVVEETRVAGAGKLALVYSGNGAQWVGMGKRLMEEAPLFRQTIEEIDALLAPMAGFSLQEELSRSPAESRFHLTEVVQPALFAVQVGLTRLLRAQGLNAEAALGHSVGEVAAAWAMGALSLEQAVRVIHERSAAQAATRGCGRMAAVGLSPEKMQETLAATGLADAVEIAGINSPHAVTLSGQIEDLEHLKRKLEPVGVFYRLLDLDYAFHSRHMEPIRERVLRDLADLQPVRGQGRFVSTVTGTTLDGRELGAEYWWRNIRQPVQFAKAVSGLIEEGYGVFLEISPHSILQHYLKESLKAGKSNGRSLPTLKHGDDSLNRLLEAGYRAHLLGCPLELSRLFPRPGHFTPLPGYPWQRERHWYGLTSEGYDLINRRRVHPLLGYRLKDGEASWENQLDPCTLPYLRDHTVSGSIVFPATAYLEMALAASVQHFGSATHEIEELEIRAPLLLDGEQARTLRFELNAQDGSFRITSRERLSEDEWSLNAVGRLIGQTLADAPEPLPIADTIASASTQLDADSHYSMCDQIGIAYGPAFRGFVQGWRQGENLLASLRLPEAAGTDTAAYLLHPILADACLQSLFSYFRDEFDQGQRDLLLPVRIGRLQFFGGNNQIRYCTTRLLRRSPHSVLVDFLLLDAEGTPVARLEGCRFRGSPISLLDKNKTAEWVYLPYLSPRPEFEAASPLPATAEILQLTHALLEQEENTLHRANHFQRMAPLFDALVGTFAHQACRGYADEQGWLSADFLPETGLSEEVKTFRMRLLGFLEEDGLIAHTGEGWKFTAEAPVSPADIWLSVLGDNPAYLPDLALAGHVGSNLTDLLSGNLDATGLVARMQASPLMEQLIESSPTYQGINLAVKETIARVAEDWPSNRRLRLLEIGHGARAYTRMILPLLPAGRCDYLIAESDEEALAHAKAEFSDQAFIHCVGLDPETLALEDESLVGRGFDLVLVEHVLEPSTDTPLLLSLLKQKLCMGGLLLLLERQPDRMADFIFGLNANWWAPNGSRFLDPADWVQLLESANYAEASAVFEPRSEDFNRGAFMLLAKNPDSPADMLPTAPEAARWLLVADPEGEARAFAESLQAWLTQHGQTAALAETDQALPEPGDYDHVVHLAGLSLKDDGPDIELLARQEQRCSTALNLVHSLTKADAGHQAKLWLVTGHGSVVSNADGSPMPGRYIPSQSALWGFGRVIMNEHPELNCTRIDLQQDSLDQHLAELLGRELLYPDGEDEILLSPDSRHVTRMQRLQKNAAPQHGSELQNVRLGFSIPGQLRNLQWQTVAPHELAEDEIEIRPMAAGLNFRDVMYALGLLSDEAVENGFSGPSMGMELSGVVTRVGYGVREFSVGDEVIAFTPAGFAKRAVTKASSAVRKPDGWSFEEAATVPTAFFTAYYALHHLARLQPGEKLLIHGAAGGVGIAAIEVARYLGAEIFATAGSDMKRDFVRLLGADHVMNSRSLAFADEIMKITAGHGIDVVLNSLAGEAVNRNLRVLRPFGRHLELGKRDFYENTKIGLRPFKDNITYYGIDADQLMVERPELSTRLFREMMQLFEQGVFRPLPYRAFPAKRIVDAFRYMQQSRQIGKIVISFANGNQPVPADSRPARKPALSRKATYLVTGGIGGFGLKTACWLAERGAGHIVLLGRRGSDTPGAAAAIAELEAAGARAHIMACDVTDPEQLGKIFETIGRELPPLKGIVHAAMVLDDGLIRNLDRERFLEVLRPKMLGAWNLHRLTERLPLDFFVLYSSGTTFIGNPGQANYVAANMYLESLAAHRRSRGLPATSACWGAIDDVGYLARNENIKEALQSRLGGAALSSDRALEQLGSMMSGGQLGVAVMDFDWHNLSRFLPGAQSPRFAELRRHAVKHSLDGASSEDIHALIANHSEEEVREILQQLLVEEIAQILRLPPERIPVDRSLYDIGMDSLMGMELMLGIETRFGINLPLMALSEGPTITRISERLAQLLLKQESADDTAAAGEAEEARMKDLVENFAARHGLAEEVPDLLQAAEHMKKSAPSRSESA